MGNQERGGTSKINTGLLAIVVALAGWNLKATHDLSVEATESRGRLALAVQEMDGKITVLAKNRWSAAHMKIWADALEKDNSTVKVRDPLEIQRNYDP